MKRIIFTLISIIFALTTISAQKIIIEDNYLKDALKELIKNAKNGDAESQYIVGMHCLLGKMIQKDETKALDYLKLSANQNYAPAFQQLGKYWLDKQNYELAEAYLIMAFNNIDQNNKHLNKEDIINMLFDLAVYYAISNEEFSISGVVNKMNEKSLNCFRLIAEYDEISLDILMLYYNKIEDYKNALKYGMMGYEKKIPSSGFWLGEIYAYGLGTTKDFDKAIKFYEFAANSEEEDVNQICRQRLSEICYNLNIQDKAFKYSYDYAHNDVDNDSGTADVLQILATCYRFGRGTKRNVGLANIWDAIAMWYCNFDKRAETIAEYEGFNPDNDEELISHILKLLCEEIDKDYIQASCSALILANYFAIVEKNWAKAHSLFIKSYNMEDAVPQEQAWAVYTINSLYEIFPSLKTPEGEKIIQDFTTREEIELRDLDNDHLIDRCIYFTLVDQIRLIEKKSKRTR